MSVQTDIYKGKWDALWKIVQSEGLLGLYAGMLSGLLQTFSSNFSYFLIYTSIRKKYMRMKGIPSTAMELLLGALAGGLSRCVTTPISVMTTRKQTSIRSYSQIMHQILEDHGIIGLWSGLCPSLVLTVNPAITYGLFERLKRILVSDKKHRLTSSETFCLGALTKALATIVTYPYIMAKARLQSNSTLKHTSAMECLRNAFVHDGFYGLYQGMSSQILKATLCQAILFTSKDVIEKALKSNIHS